MAKKSDYSLFINFFFSSLKMSDYSLILGPHYSQFIIFCSLFTIHYKKGHYSLIIIPIQTPTHGSAITLSMTPVASILCQNFQTSSMKPLGQLTLSSTQRLIMMGEWTFVQMVLVSWTRWPPVIWPWLPRCSCMVKPFKSSLQPKGQ